jgi:hypothetical protein
MYFLLHGEEGVVSQLLELHELLLHKRLRDLVKVLVTVIEACEAPIDGDHTYGSQHLQDDIPVMGIAMNCANEDHPSMAWYCNGQLTTSNSIFLRLKLDLLGPEVVRIFKEKVQGDLTQGKD